MSIAFIHSMPGSAAPIGGGRETEPSDDVLIKKMAQVEIPKAVNIPTVTKPENITVSVDVNGRIFWNASPQDDMQVFFSRIVAEARKVPQPEFHIRGDKSVRYEKVAQAMAAAQRAGLRKIGFITEPVSGETP